MKTLIFILCLALIKCKTMFYEKGTFKYLVSLQAQNGMIQVCSGVLIKPDEVVFSAQCLYEKDFRKPSIKKFRELTFYEVVAGLSSILRDENGTEARTPKSWKVHPKSKFMAETESWIYDFGVVKLDRPFTNNSNIKPLSLLKFRSIDNPKNCAMVGWGEIDLSSRKDVPSPGLEFQIKGKDISPITDEICFEKLCKTLEYCGKESFGFMPKLNQCFEKEDEIWPPLCYSGSLVICNASISSNSSNSSILYGLTSRYEGCEKENAPVLVSLFRPILSELISLAHSKGHVITFNFLIFALIKIII